MKNIHCIMSGLAALLAAAACCPAETTWQAEHVTTLPGFDVPECVLYVPATGKAYVSNIESVPDAYWANDGKGYLSLLSGDHRLLDRRWVDSRPGAVLHAPKGMCSLGEHLYFTDNTRLMRCTLEGQQLRVLADGFQKANDLATDGRSIWLSDTGAGKIFCISPSGKKREIKAPPAPNGLTFSGKRMFGVSWEDHEVYELDPTGTKAPVPFGLAKHFTNLDGIEVLDDGTFIVSDFMGNKVSTISPDRSTVQTLINTTSPADIGLNRTQGLLYVPEFKKNQCSVYRIRKP